jgi:hypothetical protein
MENIKGRFGVEGECDGLIKFGEKRPESVAIEAFEPGSPHVP